MRTLPAFRPAQRQLHGFARLLPSCRIGCALVKDHHNVRPQIALYLHCDFRTEKNFAAIYGRTKGYALLRDFAQIAKTEHLKTTRVRKNGPFPAHEIMQISMRTNHAGAGAKIQMERVS